MKLNKFQKIALAFLLFLYVFWIILFISGSTEGFYNYLYSFLFGLTPLIGGFIAMYGSRVWGGLRSSVGKAIFFIGFGMFLWGFGETIWSYYNFFLGEPAPYPSIADIGFAPSIFFYSLGTIFLAKVTGATFAIRSATAKISVFAALLFIAAASYYILVVIARGGVVVTPGETPLKVVLDILYPLGNFIGVSVALVISGLSFKWLGGHHLLDIIAILSGVFVMFIGDSVFSYTTTVGTFYNASPGDLLLTTGTFLLTFGALGFYRPKGTSE